MRFTQLLERKASGNPSEVTVQLLKKLKVPVTASTVIDTIEHHPDYPSMYSISDSLKNWNVENIALEIETEKVDELPTPFIAHSKNGGGNFILVNSVNGVVDYMDEKGRRQQKSREEFDKEWTKIVLLAEKSNQSGEKDYMASKRKEKIDSFRILSIVAVALLLIGLYSFLNPNLFVTALLLLKLVGITTTGLLLWFEIDKSNPVIQQICSGGNHSNCTAVLGSKQAKLLNFLSWSEVGFFYFAGSFLALIISSSNQPSSFALISWLNLLALPYTAFSVFYQWRIAKQWCPLCLTVQAVLVLEFITCYFGYWNSSASAGFLIPQANVSLLIGFLLPVFFWMATKKVYLNAQNGRTYRKELSKLKYNKEIFETLLSKQKQIIVSPEGLGITLGNPNASNTIIKVCNPYCAPCAKAHPIIDEILEQNNDVKVQIIFMTPDDIKAKPVKHLMALYERNDYGLIKMALDDWYNADKKDYEVFSTKYLLNGELEKQGNKIEGMAKWCKEIDILFTPTFFVNGYQLPEMYKIEDLKHLL